MDDTAIRTPATVAAENHRQDYTVTHREMRGPLRMTMSAEQAATLRIGYYGVRVCLDK